MIDFIKWCETKNLQPPTVDENTKRAGIKGIYPDAYAGRNYAYPDGYFAPISATAFLDLKNAKSKRFSNSDDAGLPSK